MTNSLQTRLSRLALPASLLVLAGLASCATSQIATRADSYPAQWEPLAERFDTGCESVSGTYKNSGESATKVDYPVTLDGAVLRYNLKSGPSDTVLLDYSPESAMLNFRLSRIDDAGGVDQASAAADVNGCMNGWLVLKRSENGYAEGTSFVSEDVVSFARSNNYLVVRHEFYIEDSSLFIFRDKTSGSRLYRFESCSGGCD